MSLFAVGEAFLERLCVCIGGGGAFTLAYPSKDPYRTGGGIGCPSRGDVRVRLPESPFPLLRLSGGADIGGAPWLYPPCCIWYMYPEGEEVDGGNPSNMFFPTGLLLDRVLRLRREPDPEEGRDCEAL